MTPKNFNDMLRISVFVDQVAHDIWKYLKERMPWWQGETLQKILSVAVFVYDGHKERQIKDRKKAKNQEADLLMVALARNLQMRERGWGGRRLHTGLGLKLGKRKGEREGMLEGSVTISGSWDI